MAILQNGSTEILTRKIKIVLFLKNSLQKFSENYKVEKADFKELIENKLP